MDPSNIAARWTSEADSLLVTSGAGMGVDSGLPDFRGNGGFWKAYPPLRQAGITFPEMANPQQFRSNPERAWGFYGHRLALYQSTRPHRGFDTLKTIGESCPDGYFSVTSNVDGHFQSAGWGDDLIWEIHGSIHRLQCTRRACEQETWEMQEDELGLRIDENTVEAKGELPICPCCGAIARPNILMFGDPNYDPTISDQQEARFTQWLSDVSEGKLLIIELGAGLAVPSIRHLSEQLLNEVPTSRLIRINPQDPQVPTDKMRNGRALALPLGALEAIDSIRKI